MVAAMLRPLLPAVTSLVLVLHGCGDDGGSGGSGGTDSDGDSGSEGSGSGGDTEGTPPTDWPETGLLGCPSGETCTFVLVSETLDDRLEIFAPRGPGAAYRGQLDLDFKPNTCDGCDPGDNGDERLDEPFGSAVMGDQVGVLVGHYPSQTNGSLLGFPASGLADYAEGSTVPVADIFSGGAFVDPFVNTVLDIEEPLFANTPDGRFLISAFDNNLFAPETTWTNPGALMLTSPAGGAVDRWTLTGLENGECHGAAQMVMVTDTVAAVACDGNEGVAFVDLAPLQAGAGQDVLVGRYCDLPATTERRVRYLASDGRGGVLVAESASMLLPENATMWWMSGDCSIQGFAQLDAASTVWGLGQVVTLPGDEPRWLFASGVGHRGLYGVRAEDGMLTSCGPIEGLDAATTGGADGDGPLDPLALALTSDGTGLAIGSAPPSAPTAGPGYGKVLWADVDPSQADPCASVSNLVDLTDGAAGHAPAVDPADPLTWRRAPVAITLVEVQAN